MGHEAIRPRQGDKLVRPSAADLTAEILTFLGADRERLENFMSTSGIDPAGIRRMSAAPGFDESLLDHLCSDDKLLVLFAQEYGYDPNAIERLRLSLQPHVED